MFRIISSIIAVLIVVALVAGVGAYAYQVGVQQGAAQGASANDGAAVAPRAVPYYYGYGFHPFGFGFGVFECLVPLFFLFLLFGVFRLIRFAIGGPRWGWGHHHGWRGHWMKDGVPPMFEEWHKKMHGEKTDEAQK